MTGRSTWPRRPGRAARGAGWPQVLCEGGPHLFGALTAAGLVDELCLTVSPLLAGPGAGRIAAGPATPAPATSRCVTLCWPTAAAAAVRALTRIHNAVHSLWTSVPNLWTTAGLPDLRA